MTCRSPPPTRLWVTSTETAEFAARPSFAPFASTILPRRNRVGSGHIRIWRHLSLPFRQRLRNVARRVDEKLHDRAERAIFQGEDTDWHRGNRKLNG